MELSLVHFFPPDRVSVQDWSANPLGISGNWFVKWDVSASLEVLPVWLLSQTSWVQTRGCLWAQRPIFSFFPIADIYPLALTRFSIRKGNSTIKYLNFNQGACKTESCDEVYIWLSTAASLHKRCKRLPEYITTQSSHCSAILFTLKLYFSYTWE